MEKEGIIMVRYYCYECKNGHGECNNPCEYVDPIGEMHNANHIKCMINEAKWIRKKCGRCGKEI
jgi:hypothetical protein